MCSCEIREGGAGGVLAFVLDFGWLKNEELYKAEKPMKNRVVHVKIFITIFYFAYPEKFTLFKSESEIKDGSQLFLHKYDRSPEWTTVAHIHTSFARKTTFREMDHMHWAELPVLVGNYVYYIDSC